MIGNFLLACIHLHVSTLFSALSLFFFFLIFSDCFLFSLLPCSLVLLESGQSQLHLLPYKSPSSRLPSPQEIQVTCPAVCVSDFCCLLYTISSLVPRGNEYISFPAPLASAHSFLQHRQPPSSATRHTARPCILIGPDFRNIDICFLSHAHPVDAGE